MSLVESALGDVSFDLGWSLIERFAVLVRESGSADERAAAHFIVSRLESMDIPYDLHEPKLYLSVPRSGAVEVAGATLAGKPPSFSASTDSKGLTGQPVHVPATTVRGGSDLFKSAVEGELPDLRGKVVVTEGLAMPVSVARFEAAGAAGQIYINPGSRVHWGICTSIWGAPTESQIGRKPTTPVVAINRPDGDRLIAAIEAGEERVTLHTELAEGWSTCSLPVARIEGESDDFVLVHGHYDSWDIGIGDNAVGDATLLELARIFHTHREGMRRSLRVAWWPAHSTGRCGGNIAWHTEWDRIEVADRANLERDLRVYLTAISEFLTAEVLPLDFRKTAAELDEALADYETKALKRFDISAIRKSLDAVKLRLDHLYTKIESGEVPADVANDLLLRLSRILVPLGYAESPRFEHDPATPRVPIPRLARLHELQALDEEEASERLPFVRTELRRQANEVAQRLSEAVWLLDLFAPMPQPETPKGKRSSKKKKPKKPKRK